MKKLLIVFALGLSVLWTALAVLAAANEDIVNVKQGAAMQKQGAMLLDVREQDEYAAVHAPGSTLIPLGQLPSRLAEIQQYKNKPVAVVCRSGRRSAQGIELLRKAGFTQAFNVDGGMNAWESAGLPVIKSN